MRKSNHDQRRPSAFRESRHSPYRRLCCERLENRCVLSAVPLTAVPDDSPSDAVEVGHPAANAEREAVGETIVRIHLEATDLEGAPITQVEVGESFLLTVLVEDARANAQGVFATYLDLLYDSGLVSVAGEIEHSQRYSAGRSGDTTMLGRINEAGSFTPSLKPVGEGVFQLFSIQMRAVAPGTTLFASDPAECRSSEITVYGLDDVIPNTSVFFGQAVLKIGKDSNPTSATLDQIVEAPDGCSLEARDRLDRRDDEINIQAAIMIEPVDDAVPFEQGTEVHKAVPFERMVAGMLDYVRAAAEEGQPANNLLRFQPTGLLSVTSRGSTFATDSADLDDSGLFSRLPVRFPLPSDTQWPELRQDLAENAAADDHEGASAMSDGTGAVARSESRTFLRGTSAEYRRVPNDVAESSSLVEVGLETRSEIFSDWEDLLGSARSF